ncbi:unnamed protein product [Pseudo-nitzschia multistriata]|uniref:CRAL-TRIO domain-containing protein n=1 Tax=Pseudo-nitzschia multistriata TaxID=183589 RepID=A0A448YXU4_9STRA|nr:unnamed protein product [Pseudo-nitzschia multistriata]
MCKNSPSVGKKIDNSLGMKRTDMIDRSAAAESYPVKAMEPPESMVAICCGCRPSTKRRNQSYKTTLKNVGWRRIFRLKRRKFRDVDPGRDVEWQAFHHYHGSESGKSIKSDYGDDDDDDSMFFFDAVDFPLGDDEFPIDGYVVGGKGKARVVFTTSIAHPAPKVSLEDPTSMLRNSEKNGSSCGGIGEDDNDSYELVPVQNDNRIENYKEPSLRFAKIRARSSEALAAELQNFPKPSPTSVEDAIGMAGYPGTLTIDELEECQKFLKGLNKLPPAVAEQVYSFRDVEDQPYTICRWLRATKFDADAILARLSENQPLFEQAKEKNFYGPNLDDYLGCPLSVFLSQYPFMSIGRGRNGSPVNYFLAGKINPEGIMALCTVDQLASYFWYSFMYKMKEEVRRTQRMDPDFCRCEGINIVDLSGLSTASLTSETMEVIKIASKVSDFFPETLHAMLVLNAPSFFTFSWKLIKNFIDPRTASRIQLFSSQQKGQDALENLIDKEKEISKDYGGGNVSLREAFLRECSDPQIVRQEIELIHCKRKSTKAIPKAWTLGENECIEITIYTRSVSEADIHISFNGSAVKTVKSRCKFEGDGRDRKPLPNKTVAVYAKFKEFVGPGEVLVEAHDLDSTISKQHSGQSRGYFLVVGDIKPISSVASTGTNSTKQKRKVSFVEDTESSPSRKNYNAAVTMAGLVRSKTPRRDSI